MGMRPHGSNSFRASRESRVSGFRVQKLSSFAQAVTRLPPPAREPRRWLQSSSRRTWQQQPASTWATRRLRRSIPSGATGTHACRSLRTTTARCSKSHHHRPVAYLLVPIGNRTTSGAVSRRHHRRRHRRHQVPTVTKAVHSRLAWTALVTAGTRCLRMRCLRMTPPPVAVAAATMALDPRLPLRCQSCVPPHRARRRGISADAACARCCRTTMRESPSSSASCTAFLSPRRLAGSRRLRSGSWWRRSCRDCCRRCSKRSLSCVPGRASGTCPGARTSRASRQTRRTCRSRASPTTCCARQRARRLRPSRATDRRQRPDRRRPLLPTPPPRAPPLRRPAVRAAVAVAAAAAGLALRRGVKALRATGWPRLPRS